MTEEGQQPSEADDRKPRAGSRLAEARLARELSLDEIARELHLDGAKVRDLEENRFDNLGAPVFVKGYLRKYAELVGVSVDAVLEDYDGLKHSGTAPPLIAPRRPADARTSPLPWIVVLILAAAAGVGAWLWYGGAFAGSAEGGSLPETARPVDSAPATGSASADNEVSRPPAPRQGEPPVAGESGDTADAAEEVDPEADPEAASEVDDTSDRPDATVAAGDAQGENDPDEARIELTLAFSGECWAELIDAAGESLFVGLGSAGRQVSVTGVAPVRVVLGNAANASLEVDGEAWPVPDSAGRGDVARFLVTP